jgi:geranylgeranyl reductase family protein
MVSIIGAGPVGSYLAHKLASNGLNVDVYEDHKKIGIPVACTGILTNYIKSLIKIDDDWVVNKINQTNVYSPNGNSVNIGLKKNYVVDRTLFDLSLAEMAKSAGVKYHKNFRFLSSKQNKEKKYSLKFQNGKKIDTSILVGADGPNSSVAKSAGIIGERKFIAGQQARVRMKSKIDSNIVEFFLDEGNYIGWLVPESNRIARIGVASNKNLAYRFNNLMKSRPGKILCWQSGSIPLFNSKIKVEKGKTFLVGDAASQVKATTYGGIIPGMNAAKALNDCLIKDYSSGDYPIALNKSVNKNLKAHLFLRKLMNKFTKKDYNSLINFCENNKIKKILHKYDREYPSKLLFSLFLAEPKFAKFGLKILKKEI